MKKIYFPLFIVLCAVMPCENALCFHEVALNGAGGVSEGYVDRYGTDAGAAAHHTVWLYTNAACDTIRWTLGEQTHSEHLACGTTTGFMGVPEGTHHMVIEGCGKRIAAYLSVKRDVRLMIEPSDLNTGNHCAGGDLSEEDSSYYIDFFESSHSLSLISEL